MLDFQKIAELTFVTLILDEMVILDSGLILTGENVCEFINSTFDT